jgi:hypothetical protein
LNHIPTIMSVSGGTQTNVTIDSQNYRVHTFNTSANITINSLSDTPSYNTFSILAVGGGGAPWWVYATCDGGGAGGLLIGSNTLPIGNTVVEVGAGAITGSGTPADCGYGANTTLSTPTTTIIAYGGGGAGFRAYTGPGQLQRGTGSSGGYTNQNTPTYPAAPASQPDQYGLTGYANQGGGGSYYYSGSGGGAGSGGSQGQSTAVLGGAGRSLDISGSNVYYAGGGSAGSGNPSNPAIPGSQGGGGAGAYYSANPGPAYYGQQNTGGGSGGGINNSSQWYSQGGSGIVIIRYPVI